MIRVERTKNMELVRDVVTHPKVWPHVTDDGASNAAAYQPLALDAVHYVAAYDDDELLGVWGFFPQNTVCYEVHTMMLPNGWGKRALVAAAQAAQWMWANTRCARIVTNVPACNRLALAFAKNAGMAQYGLNPGSYLKNGILWDQFMLGMNRPETQCQ